MSSIALIALPYDSGRFEERTGRGPSALVEGGLIDALRSRKFDVDLTSIRLPAAFQTEASALLELQGRAVSAMREAISRGARPILLSGNCGPAVLSAAAALRGEPTGVIWFDAHGDFNTPETSPSGFLDGMGLSILAGQCWSALARRLENFPVFPMENVVQIGVRDVDPEEGLRLEQSAITRIAPDCLPSLDKAMEELAARVSKVYVHVDVDVLDTSEGMANSYACPGGLTFQDLYQAIELIGASVPIAAGSITSYDPEMDKDGRIARGIPRIIDLLARP